MLATYVLLVDDEVDHRCFCRCPFLGGVRACTGEVCMRCGTGLEQEDVGPRDGGKLQREGGVVGTRRGGLDRVATCECADEEGRGRRP